MTDSKKKPDSYWKEALKPEVFHITREGGTEPPFSGEYNEFKGKAIFRCACCNTELFRSDEKFDSGSGWPSFWQPFAEDRIKYIEDNSLFMRRTEVQCAACDAHLGHVFPDGPKPTGQRYCINSLSLQADKKE